MSTSFAGRFLSPRTRRWGGRLGLLALLALLLPFVVFAVPQAIGADHGFVVLSGSMEPVLSPGDVIIVDGSGSVGVGDVITYDGGDAVPVTHRVVGVEDGQFVTQGDANSNPDAGTVTPADVLGRVVLTIPLIGHVVLWVQTPLGYVTLVVAPLVLLLGSELRSWARKRDDGQPPGDDPDDLPADDPLADDPLLEALTADDPLAGALASDDPLADALAVDLALSETGERDATTGVTETVVSVPPLEPDSPGEATPAADASASTTVAVAAADLKLTLLAAGSLFAYAGWNVVGEVTAVGAPNPVSVGAMTGGLLGLVFAGWVTISVWYAGQQGTGGDPSPPAAADASASGSVPTHSSVPVSSAVGDAGGTAPPDIDERLLAVFDDETRADGSTPREDLR